MWGGGGYASRIFATTRSVDEFRNNSRFHDCRPAGLSGREAALFVQGSPTEPANCNIFYGTSQGTIQMFVADDQVKKDFPDPCDLVIEAARAVDSWIPR